MAKPRQNAFFLDFWQFSQYNEYYLNLSELLIFRNVRSIMSKKILSRLCAAGFAFLLSVTAAFPSFAMSALQDEGPGFEDTFEESGRDAYEAGLKSEDGDTGQEETVTGIITVSAETGASPAEAIQETETGTQGAYLGRFKVTGYCNCPICSGGSGRTYSGTYPKADHTIAADISLYPIGTKLMCEGIIYTVEDCGSGVVGNTIDIYFDDHDKAVGYGTQYHDVYAVE